MAAAFKAKGTYLDSPFHRYEDGHDLSQLRLEQMADLEAIVIRAPFQKVEKPA